MESAGTRRDGLIQVLTVEIATIGEDGVAAYKAQTY
jgi:hypothetical protein